MKVIAVNSWVHKVTDMVFWAVFSSHSSLTQGVCQNLSQDASLLSVIYIDNAHSVWFNNNNINTFNRFSNNWKWAYQSISHEIMRYHYWMTSSQSECHYTQWAKINSRKLKLTLMRISKEDSSDHQSHWQNTWFCLYQKRMTQSNCVSTTDNSTR